MAATPTKTGAGRRPAGSKPRQTKRPGSAGRDDPRATPADYKRYATGLNKAEKDAYQAGRRGEEGPSFDAPDSVQLAHRTGREEHDAAQTAPAPAPAAAPTPAPARAPARGSTVQVGEEGASFLLGVVAYALVINYLRYGWPGVTGWLSAKFLNRVTLAPTPTGGGPSLPAATPLPTVGGVGAAAGIAAGVGGLP